MYMKFTCIPGGVEGQYLAGSVVNRGPIGLTVPKRTMQVSPSAVAIGGLEFGGGIPLANAYRFAAKAFRRGQFRLR